MIGTIATTYIMMACLNCGSPQEPVGLQITFQSPSDSFGALSFGSDASSLHGIEPRTGYSIARPQGGAFSIRNLSDPRTAAEFGVRDLATPIPLRGIQGQVWGGEVAFGAYSASTGLGLDLEVAPRAQITRDGSGNNVSRAGAEVRLGQNLTDRDQRGTGVAAPSWYFFVGQDNEALIWNVGDKQRLDGLALRDQVTVGDLQAGVAISTPGGGQMSLGLVEREMSFSDMTGENSISTTNHFAAFSFTLRK